MQKVNYRKALSALLFIFLMIFFSGMFVGCGSSKKHKEKESYENTVKTEIDSSSSSSVKTDDKVKEENKVSEELSEEVLDVELKDGEELEITNLKETKQDPQSIPVLERLRNQNQIKRLNQILKKKLNPKQNQKVKKIFQGVHTQKKVETNS